MSVRQISLEVYNEISLDGTAATQRMEIKDFLKRFSDGLTRAEVSEMNNIPINAVCGRINELIKEGSVYEDGKKINKYTNKMNYILKVR